MSESDTGHGGKLIRLTVVLNAGISNRTRDEMHYTGSGETKKISDGRYERIKTSNHNRVRRCLHHQNSGNTAIETHQILSS